MINCKFQEHLLQVFCFCLFLTLALYSKTSVGARGHTTGRILRRLETEQKYGTYTSCGSKLPPPGACVMLVLNQSRLHMYHGRKIKRYRKTSGTRYCASAAGNNRYKPDGFPHPPTTPEGSVSGSRRPGNNDGGTDLRPVLP